MNMTRAIKDLSMKEYFNNTVRNKRMHDTDQPGSEDVRGENIRVNRYGNYFNVSNVIAMAGPVDPLDFDSPFYNRERVFEHLEHNAEVIHVSNDAVETQAQPATPLYVIESHKSIMGFSNEVPIYPQQEKEFYNIYELRLRSATVGAPYRVSSYLTRLI
jgi:hypothetical protein